jgi:hypothetical protein
MLTLNLTSSFKPALQENAEDESTTIERETTFDGRDFQSVL